MEGWLKGMSDIGTRGRNRRMKRKERRMAGKNRRLGSREKTEEGIKRGCRKGLESY